MQPDFKVAKLLQAMGEHVTHEFEEAGLGTTATIVGDARERTIRTKLDEVLAGNNRVTTGVVIDSEQRASQQTDVIIHEAGICPVFKIGGRDGEEYIPCEGVWAAGEVKSRLRTEDLRSICAHSMSVRRLRRHAVPTRGVLTKHETVCYRRFGTPTAFEGTKEESFDQDKKESDRIFTFGIVGRWEMQDSKCSAEFLALMRHLGNDMVPNMIVGIDKGMLLPARLSENSRWSPVLDWSDAHGVAVSDSIKDRWRKLVGILNMAAFQRRTVAVEAYRRYTDLFGGISPFSMGVDTRTLGSFHFTPFA